MQAGSAVEIQETFQAVNGVVGPRPTAFLDPSVELCCNGSTLTGSMAVASALRELTAGARDIQLDIDSGHATATWVISTATKTRSIVMVDFEVADGRIVRISASELRSG